MAPECPEITQFITQDLEQTTGGLLRQVADWLDAEEGRVLIGLWSVGFGEPWQIDLQVVTTYQEPDGGPA
jgi:hypothetical protein